MTQQQFSHAPNITLLYEEVNLGLAKLNNWFCVNKLSLNAKKTKYILFRPTATYPDLNNMYIYTLNELLLDRIGNSQISHSNS